MSDAAPLRLPAEWEPQAGVMLTWPHPASDWAQRLDNVYPVFAELGAAISAHQLLLNVCHTAAHRDLVRERLQQRGADPARLRFAVAPANDTWARDHAPLTPLAGGVPRLEQFRFNGWGGKFEAGLDATLGHRLHTLGAFGATPFCEHDFVIEGGAIETDGAGTLLATRSSVLTATRNPQCDQAAVEEFLRRRLGLERFLWLDYGDIDGDDTDGHIDTLARFADPSTILHTTAPADDPDNAALAAMAEQLAGFRSSSGTAYRLLPLPFPGVHRDFDGRRLPATYANFLLINGAVLMPTYAVPADNEAREILSEAFPGRRVIGIDCREIIAQSGSLHCLTMQFPAAVQLRDAEASS